MIEHKKIIFLGESTAHGFLYAPYYTPAKYLYDILEKNGMNCTVDDRTKVSIRMPELIKRCILAAEEEPDFVIVYAGSNWRKALWNLSKDETHQIYEFIESGTPWYLAIRMVFKVKAAEQINGFFEQMKSLFLDRGIHFLFVLPGFNLRDWQYGSYDIELNSPYGITDQWNRLTSAPPSCENAQKMMNLDPANPSGYKIMADLAYKDKDISTARKMYISALNTNLYRPGPPPAGNDLIADCVINAARESGILVCDTMDVISEYHKDDIPGHDVFIDYCHFNDEGIRMTCAKLAGHILSWQHRELTVLPKTVPDKIVSSHAHFYSAVHSAHLGNISTDFLLYHFRKALALYDGIADKLVKYCRLATKKTPWYLCGLFTEIDTMQYPAIRKQDDCMVMDIELTNVMITALKEVGVDIQDEIQELRIENHTYSSPLNINLLENYYKESSYFNVFAGSQSADPTSRKKLYLSLRSRNSNFYLILDEIADIICDFIIRVPSAVASQNVSLLINGMEFFNGESGSNWQRIKTDIPASSLKRGLNILSIRWPKIQKHALHTSSSQEYILDYIRPVYGDILRLTITGNLPFYINLKDSKSSIYSRHVAGNKGYNLMKLCRMGIRVPDGFIIPAYTCQDYYRKNEIMSVGIRNMVISGIRELEQRSGKRLDDAENPLLLSIRSGAAVSMPGMLDTILNAGFQEVMCLEAYQFRAYISFIKSYAASVKHINLKECVTDGLGVDQLKDVLAQYKDQYQRESGEPFPEDSMECIINSVEAVFQSWNKSSAVLYRKNKGISDSLYTAVIIQQMVFGNRNSCSGTGVVFSQNPLTKEKKIYGEYLSCAQGEEIVSGASNPMPMEQLSKAHPEIYGELYEIINRIEDGFGTPQDIEFTYEDGKVYILQTRNIPV